MTNTPPPENKEASKEKETFTRFSFDNDFFEVAPPPGRKTPTPAPTAERKLTGAEPRTIKNVKEALEQGYAEGFEAASKQAEATYRQELESLKVANQAAIQSLTQASQKAGAELTRTALTFLRASLHHLVGHAAENYPDQVLETHLKALVGHVSSHEELTLRIAPAARGFHEKLGLSHANIQGVGFHIKEDGGLKPTDCVAEWRRGGAEVKLADHLARLDALLIGSGAENVAIPTPTPNQAIPPAPQAATPPATQPTPVTQHPTSSDTFPATSLQDTPNIPPSSPQDPASKLADELRADNDLVDALK